METDERIVLRHHQTHKPVPNQRYIAHLEDGRTIEGISDEQGRTSLARNTTMDQVRFHRTPQPEQAGCAWQNQPDHSKRRGPLIMAAGKSNRS